MPTLTMWRRVASLSAFTLLAMQEQASAGFGLPHMDHHGFDTARITGITIGDPAKTAEALHGSLDKVAQGIQEVGKKQVDNAKAAIQDLSGNAAGNLSDALQAVPKEQLEHVVRAAAGSLQNVAEAINNTNKENLMDGVSSTLQGAKDAATQAVVSVSGGANPKDVANALSGNAPKVAEMVNRTGIEVAGALQHVAPKAAQAIQNMAPHKGTEADGTLIPLEVGMREVAKVTASANFLPACLVVVLAGTGGFLAFRHFKGSSARSPGLLMDRDMNMHIGGGRRQQGGTDEPFFTQMA